MWLTDGFGVPRLPLSLPALFKKYITVFTQEGIREINSCCTKVFSLQSLRRVCLPPQAAHTCRFQTQLRPCAAQTSTTGRWVEYKSTSNETSPTVKHQSLLFIGSLLDASADSKNQKTNPKPFNISYPSAVLKTAITKSLANRINDQEKKTDFHYDAWRSHINE